MFELSTDTPGFAIDESMETMGENLANAGTVYEKIRDQSMDNNEIAAADL
ncbi:hypothetical protein ACIQD3_15050 [Peribacillus loiseleuriae]